MQCWLTRVEHFFLRKLRQLASVLLLTPSLLEQAKVIILILVVSISSGRSVLLAANCLLRVGAQLCQSITCCEGQP